MNVELAIALGIPTLGALIATVLIVDGLVRAARAVYRIANRRHVVGDHRFPADKPTLGEVMTLRREPATLWMGLLAPVAQMLAAFFFVDDPVVQGAVNAVAVAVAGALTAFLVKSDNLLPAITGAIQAVIALVLAFGVQWTPEQQAALMVGLGAIAAFLVRDRVTAPVPAPTVNA